MNFLRRNHIVLNCYTHDYNAFTNAKVDYAIKYVPEWWRVTPKVVDNYPTIKNCPGFIEYYKKGIVIPSWSEVEMTINEKGAPRVIEWRSASAQFSTNGSHLPCQFQGFAQEDGHNVKFESVWIIQSDQDASFLTSQAVWSNREWVQSLTMMPGVLNFKYQYNTNMNYLVTVGAEKKKFTLPALTPLMLLHPMSDKKVVLQHHLIDKPRWEAMSLGKRQLFLRWGADKEIGLYNKVCTLTNRMK